MLKAARRIPYPGKIPGLLWLFGATSKSKARTELIVLITPRVITSSQSRQVTDDYRQQMQLLKVEPLRPRLR